jgi:Co/Zn/Cd efflux system component
VVAVGIVGSLFGVRLLDPIAAAIVGFLVARMGWVFGWDALQDLSDRALDETATDDIRQLLMTTAGVRDVHELRTRKMGDLALVDAHILVDPLISVSEGHYIAESARTRVMTDKRVLDALIHVDPENDALAHPPARLPTRAAVAALVDAELAKHGLRAAGLNVHYLSTGLDVDITLPADAMADREHDAELIGRIDLAQIKSRLGARNVTVQRQLAPATARAPGHA